jgi:hypothetical protein
MGGERARGREGQKGETDFGDKMGLKYSVV